LDTLWYPKWIINEEPVEPLPIIFPYNAKVVASSGNNINIRSGSSKSSSVITKVKLGVVK